MSFTAHEISKENNKYVWLTPPKILEKLGPFDLDPSAAPLPRPWDTAKTMWTEASDDGLAKEWFGRVWLNPPYGRLISNWMEKMAHHGNGVAITYVRTDTAWFQKWVFPFVSGIFCFNGRVKFHHGDGRLADAASAPHVLLAYGEENAKIVSNFDWPGKWVPMKTELHTNSGAQMQ